MIKNLNRSLAEQTILGAGIPFARKGAVLLVSVGIYASGAGNHAYATMDNTFTASGTSPGGATVEDQVDEVVDLIDAAPAAAVIKTSATTSVDDTSDTIDYTISVENTGNVSLTNIGITDTLTQNGTNTSLTLVGPTGDTDSDGEIDVEETWGYTVSYTPTQPNIDDGNDIVNQVEFTFDETGATVFSDDHTVTITQNNDVTITKVADVANVDAAGDIINYTIEVTNNGNTAVTGISVTDPIGPVECASSGTTTIASLAPLASETCTIAYTVEQADLDQRGARDGGPDGIDNDIDNTVTVTGTAGTTPFTETATAEVGLTLNPELNIVKSFVLNDEVTADGVAEATETITYTFTVENTGNVTMTNIVINEVAFDGQGPAPVPGGELLLTDVAPTGDSTDAPAAPDGTWSILAPGDIITFTANYTVTQGDVDNP